MPAAGAGGLADQEHKQEDDPAVAPVLIHGISDGPCHKSPLISEQEPTNGPAPMQVDPSVEQSSAAMSPPPAPPSEQQEPPDGPQLQQQQLHQHHAHHQQQQQQFQQPAVPTPPRRLRTSPPAAAAAGAELPHQHRSAGQEAPPLQRSQPPPSRFEGPATGAGGSGVRATDRMVDDLVQENGALRKSLASLRKEYERTNVELKERIRTLQLELEQDRSRVINEAVTGDHGRLREIRETLVEAHRDLPDVIPTKTMGQVTKHEVKQVLKSSGLPVEHLQEAAAAIDACISDKSYDPFERDEHGHIVGHDVEHELLFPLKQQYGPAAVDLVLIKKQELDHSANDLRPRTVLWSNGHELEPVEAVRRLIGAAIEARQAHAMNGAGAHQPRGAGGVCWEEWLGFQKGRVGLAPHETSVIGDDVVEGYQAWVARARHVSARSAAMYLNDLNKLFRFCLRALGVADVTMDQDGLRKFCVDNWDLIEQEAGNQKSKSVDQGLSYLKGYLHLEDAELPPSQEEDTSSGPTRKALGESVLEAFSVWLRDNTATKESTWKSYGRAINCVVADALRAEGREGLVLEADEIRDFVIQHRESLEKQGASDARRYVNACFRYFLRFLGLLDTADEELEGARKEPIALPELPPASEPKEAKKSSRASGEASKAASTRNLATRRSTDRLPLADHFAEAFGRHLTRKAGMKEGTSVEYQRYVNSWVNDLIDMDDVEVPGAVDTLDREQMLKFIKRNEDIIRKYGNDLKKASKKGKVSAWRHFMIFLGLADPDEDWITRSALAKAPTLRGFKPPEDDELKPAARGGPPSRGVLSTALRSSFSAFLVDKQEGPGVADGEVKDYVESVERSLKAYIKAHKAPADGWPTGADEIRAFAEQHFTSLEEFFVGLKRKPRAALSYLLQHLGANLPSAPESSTSPARLAGDEVQSGEVMEPSKEGPLGVALVASFAGWLRGERPLTAAEVQRVCKAVGALLAQAFKDANVAGGDEAHELHTVEAAQAFLTGKDPALKAALDALLPQMDAKLSRELMLFKAFLDHASTHMEEVVASAGGGAEEEVVGPHLMDEFAAETVERGASGQMAALQVLHVLAQVRRQTAAPGPEEPAAPPPGMLHAKEEVLHFLAARPATVRRVLRHAPYHTDPLERFMAFLGADEATRDAATGTEGQASMSLSVALSADLLLWLVEYRAMTIVQAEFVVRALDHLIAYLLEDEAVAATLDCKPPLGVREVAQLVLDQKARVTASVQQAADNRFKTAYSLFCRFHFKEDPFSSESSTEKGLKVDQDADEEDDETDGDEMDDEDPWGKRGMDEDGEPEEGGEPDQQLKEEEEEAEGEGGSKAERPVMSKALRAAISAHLTAYLGDKASGQLSTASRLISTDLAMVMAASSGSTVIRTLKTKEDLRRFLLLHSKQVRGRRSATPNARKAWDGVLNFLDLKLDDLPLTEPGSSKRTPPPRATPPPKTAKRAASPAPTGKGSSAKKPATTPAPSKRSLPEPSLGPGKKVLGVTFRKDFKRYMRTSSTNLSKDTRKLYSDLICEVIRAVMLKKSKAEYQLDGIRETREYVAQHFRDIDLACDNFVKRSSWTNFQNFLGIPKGGKIGGKEAVGSKRGHPSGTASASKKRATPTGKGRAWDDEEDGDEDERGSAGRKAGGAQGKRKRLEVEEDEDDESEMEDDEDDEGLFEEEGEDMDGDDELEESDNDDSEGHPKRKRKRQEPVLDPKLAGEFESWLQANKGITSGTCYSGWVRQLLRRVYHAAGRRFKMVRLVDVPGFLDEYTEEIQNELAVPRKDGRNSAWRHFLTYTVGSDEHAFKTGRASPGPKTVRDSRSTR